MGKGLSQQQKQILGLACRVQALHRQPIGRGEYFRLSDECWRAGLLAVREADQDDVTQPLAVHLVWKIPLCGEIRFDATTYGSDSRGEPFYRSAYYATNSGAFANNPATKSAKVAATKALRRLVERELLAIRFSSYCRGFVLTAAGAEVGKNYADQVDVCDSMILDAFGEYFNCHGKLALQSDSQFNAKQAAGSAKFGFMMRSVLNG